MPNVQWRHQGALVFSLVPARVQQTIKKLILQGKCPSMPFSEELIMVHAEQAVLQNLYRVVVKSKPCI